jgi:hypothetical protein
MAPGAFLSNLLFAFSVMAGPATHAGFTVDRMTFLIKPECIREHLIHVTVYGAGPLLQVTFTTEDRALSPVPVTIDA